MRTWRPIVHGVVLPISDRERRSCCHRQSGEFGIEPCDRDRDPKSTRQLENG
jgi:hypothetical protein